MNEISAKTPLDEVDQRLLSLLQDDAARSNQALADAAHVSAATALRRVRRHRDGLRDARLADAAGPDHRDQGVPVEERCHGRNRRAAVQAPPRLPR